MCGFNCHDWWSSLYTHKCRYFSPPSNCLCWSFSDAFKAQLDGLAFPEKTVCGVVRGMINRHCSGGCNRTACEVFYWRPLEFCRNHDPQMQLTDIVARALKFDQSLSSSASFYEFAMIYMIGAVLPLTENSSVLSIIQTGITLGSLVFLTLTTLMA